MQKQIPVFHQAVDKAGVPRRPLLAGPRLSVAEGLRRELGLGEAFRPVFARCARESAWRAVPQAEFRRAVLAFPWGR